MKIGLAVAECINSEINHNLSQILKYLDIAKVNKIDYIFLGESFLQGFDSLEWSFETDRTIAVSRDNNIIKMIKDVARKNNVGVGFGYFELYNQAIYSSYLVVGQNGEEIINYRRVSKGWKEYAKTDSYYKEGENINSFIIHENHFSVALCGDLWDEETLTTFMTDTVRNSNLLWPVHVDFSLEEWSNQLKEYHNQALLFSKNVFLINNILKPSAHGGAFKISETGIEKIGFDLEEMLIVDL
jgi:N-carbamoylputrescine amidase